MRKVRANHYAIGTDTIDQPRDIFFGEWLDPNVPAKVFNWIAFESYPIAPPLHVPEALQQERYPVAA